MTTRLFLILERVERRTAESYNGGNKEHMHIRAGRVVPTIGGLRGLANVVPSSVDEVKPNETKIMMPNHML